MASPFATPHNSNAWMNQHPSYQNKGGDPDPFFDPQSLEMTNNEFKPVPLPDDDFEPFLDKFNDIDNMLSETLAFQDLGIPSGYQQQEYLDNNGYRSSTDGHQKKHSRRISGSAIFGFANGHSHQLSIPGINVTENNFKKGGEPIFYDGRENNVPNHYQPMSKPPANNSPPKRSMEHPETADNDFIITSKNPVAFKFPPNNGSRSSTQSPIESLRGDHSAMRTQKNASQQKTAPEQYPATYMNRLQGASKEQVFSETGRTSINHSPQQIHRDSRHASPYHEQRGNFYLIPTDVSLKKPLLALPDTNLEYSSPEELYSSPNNSPILPHNMFISPQHNPPQGPELQTPQKMKLPPAPKLEPASLRTPTKYTIVAKNQEDIAEKYNYDAGSSLIETPKKQMTDNEQVFWTPILITKEDPNSAKIIKDQAKRNPSPVRKETKITSTLPKGHLDQYFFGPDENQKFTCIYQGCNKQFSRISNARAHIQTHLSDRPFTCSMCPKSFVRHHDLRRHEKSHQEFTFECPCGKKFPRQDALKRHRIRKICSGAIDDDKQVSPDKKNVTKPAKKKGRPRKEDELHEGLRDRLLEDLDFAYLGPADEVSRSDSNLILADPESAEDQRNLEQDSSDTLDQFYYENFNL